MRSRLFAIPILIIWTSIAGCVNSTDQAETGTVSVAAKSDNGTSLDDANVDENRNADELTGATAEAQDRQPPRTANSRSNNIETITFEDLNLGMQPDIVFRPWMVNERANQLRDKRVRITGYMDPGVQQSSGFKDFILLKNTNCKFGPGGQADHLVWVKFTNGVSASFTDKVVQVEGTLVLHPYVGPDGNTWSIYDLRADVFTTRPQWQR
jgi:hypothetical protein